MLNVFPRPSGQAFDRTLLQQRGPLIRVQVGVPSTLAAHLSAAGSQIPQPIITGALIDTGASVSAIDSGELAKLGLQPTGQTSLATPSDHQATANTFSVSLTFPQAPAENATFDPFAVVGCILRPQGIGALLGRDFLEIATLIYNGPGGFFTLAF